MPAFGSAFSRFGLISLALIFAFGLAGCRKKKNQSAAPQRPDLTGINPKTKPQFPTASDSTSKEVETITHAHTRLVWCEYQKRGEADPYSRDENSKLMGLDTRDGLGPRAILKDVGNYTRPILSTDGKTILYTRRWREQDKDGKWASLTAVHRTDWAGTATVEIADGYAVDAWADPATGTEWIYALRRFRGSRSAGIVATQLVRFPLNEPKKRELLFDDSQMTPDNMQVSRDGTRIGGVFPWPRGGLLISDGEKFSVKKLQIGCWPSLAPDDSHLFWIFDGDHKSVYCFAEDGARSWELKFDAPALAHSQTYHPRWSNHPRFFTLTGPYKETGETGNVITIGGARAQVFLGQLSERADKVESWLQVTHGKLACSYPDAWIEGGEKASLVLAPPVQDKTAPPTALAQWPTTSDGLLFLWRDRSANNSWKGRDGKTYDARLNLSGAARYGRSGELLLDSGTAELEQDADSIPPLIKRLKEKDPDFTFEAIVIPPSEPAAGVVLSTPRLEIKAESEDSMVIVTEKSLARFKVPAHPFHLLVTVTAGNGVDVKMDGANALAIGQTLAWSPKNSSVTFGGGNWRGSLRNIAFYDRILTLDEIAKSATAQLAQIKALPAPAPRVRLKGKLVEVSAVPSAKSIEPYTRALVTYVYEVENVLSGDFKEPRVLVKHWAMLDSRTTTGFPRQKGQSYELTLEPGNEHPELQGERAMDDTGVFDLQAWLDVSPPSLPPSP